MEALAKRWERTRSEPEKERRSAADERMDAAFERWKSESAPGCLPCLLEELE